MQALRKRNLKHVKTRARKKYRDVKHVKKLRT